MRSTLLMLSLGLLCLGRPALAQGATETPASTARSADDLDSVVLVDGELVRGTVLSSDDSGVRIRLRSGMERAIPRGDVRIINSWGQARLFARNPPLGPPPVLETRWYGWQTVSADLLALGFMAGGIASASNSSGPVLGILSLSTYLLGAPIIHGFHQDDLGTSLGSLGLRIGLPLAGGGIAFAIAKGTGDSCAGSRDELCGLGAAIGMLAGGLVGAVGASAVDAIFLARETVPVDRNVSLAPLLLPRGSGVAPQGGTGVAFAARF